MSYIQLKNGDTVALNHGQAVARSTINVPITSVMPGAPIHTAIVFPIGDLTGRIKIIAGPGTVTHTLTASVVVDPLFPVFVNRTINIPGPGTYYLPIVRNELIRNMKRITTNVDPGGSLTISLEAWKAILASNESGPDTLIGVIHHSVINQDPGQNILIVQSGGTLAIASGAITKNDQLITSTNGKLKSIGMVTGVDIVGIASEDAVDGAEFTMNVALSSI